MAMQDTFFLPAGFITTLTGSADLTGGSYVQLGNPGDAPGTPVAVAASTAVVLGPFNTGRYYKTNTTLGTITHAESFQGYSETSLAEEQATVSGVGAKNGVTVTATEKAGVWKRTKLTCVATPITISDDAGVAQYGGVKLYDFPEGLLCIQGAVIDGAITAGVTGTIIDAFTGVIALGTATASTGATLESTEADILQSTELTTAVAKVAVCDAVSIATALTESGARWHDGTGTAKDLFLNVAIADDATHTAGSATFTGTVEFVWMSLGDK